MGLISRKNKSKQTEEVSPTKLEKMATEDIYILMETSLMSAQHQLAEFRSSAPADKKALLNWIASHIGAAGLGCKEMAQRI